jgi:hypothetical protein
MNIWNRILHRINQKNIPLPLGRWKLESCHQKINQKIDSSNEDHCGTCANGDKSRELTTTTTALVTYHISSVLPVRVPIKTNQISILSPNNGKTSRS